jgi:outer membrane protein assembly factor BamD
MFSRRWIPLSLLLVILVALPAPPARAAWVWTPQTGWIGPAGMPKDTPAAQLDHATSFFEKGDYDTATIEFKKLLRHYRDSREAADAQYYLGRCLESERDYYKAFLEYRKTVQVYPSSARFNEVLERMAQIGNYFLSGKKRKIMGGAAILPARDKAIEIFQAIVEDGPFSPQGELAQYKLGLAHLALEEYEQAVTAFDQLIERYPNSTLVDDARFQIAQASLKGTFKPGYDQHATDQAIEELDAFIEEYPTSDLSPDAVNKLQSLRERRAEHEFGVAQYYERRQQLASAILYYEAVVEQYADTTWAPKATERLAVLEPLATP